MMKSKPVLKNKQLYKMLDSQTMLLWSQFFTLEPRKVKESNILGFYIRIRDGDAKALEQAYNKVIETNDSLRLRFCRIDLLKIRQFIDDFAYISLPQKILSGEQEFEDYLRQISKFSLPMYGERLYWAELVRIPGDSIVLVMRFHHLIMDGYSISLIFNRIAEAYEAFTKGQVSEPIQYSILHGIEQQQKYKKSQRHAQDRKFWKNSFNRQPNYSFPAGKRSQKGACDMQEISLGGQLYLDTIELASRLYCSVQCLVMSAAAFTVYKITRQTNFCIYSLTHGRYDAAARKTIGCLMNTVPVFFNLNPDQTLQCLIQEEYMNFLETLKHGQFSLSEQTPLSYKEPIRHCFNFNHAWLLISAMEYGAAFSNSAYEAKMIPGTNQPYQFYAMVLEIPGERIDIRLRYQTRKFSAGQVRYFLQQYSDTIRKITLNPDSRLSEIRKEDEL